MKEVEKMQHTVETVRMLLIFRIFRLPQVESFAEATKPHTSMIIPNGESLALILTPKKR